MRSRGEGLWRSRLLVYVRFEEQRRGLVVVSSAGLCEEQRRGLVAVPSAGLCEV